jgi:hypothetical protein
MKARGTNMRQTGSGLDDIEEQFDQADEDRDDQINLTELRCERKTSW